jgi:hypothetical protein
LKFFNDAKMGKGGEYMVLELLGCLCSNLGVPVLFCFERGDKFKLIKKEKEIKGG